MNRLTDPPLRVGVRYVIEISYLDEEDMPERKEISLDTINAVSQAIQGKGTLAGSEGDVAGGTWTLTASELANG